MTSSFDPEPMARRIARALAGARRLCFITGAGLSAESGLPTYRGVGGLYNDVATDEGLPIEDLLSGAMFARDPALTWKYIARIERACRGATFNAAHAMIAALEAHFDVVVITQNVDGFHRAAGSTRVIELHGDLHRLYCTGCDRRVRVTDYAGLELPPRCPACAGIVRPDVVLFGEMLPAAAIAAQDVEHARGFDALFAVGTTAGFPYISGPVLDAVRRGVPAIEINPDRTVLSASVTHRLPAGAVVALAAITDALGLPRP